MKFNQGDILEVPFPFVDRPVKKSRPAFVLSNPIGGDGFEILVLAMVTSAKRSKWRHDVELEDWRKAGLKAPSILRWKVFSLDVSLILGRRGSVTASDLERIHHSFREVFTPF